MCVCIVGGRVRVSARAHVYSKLILPRAIDWGGSEGKGGEWQSEPENG